MADVAGQPRPDLTGALPDPERMGFFELLRRLETGDMRFGRAGGPDREPARLGQRVRLSVATGDIAGFSPGNAQRPAKVDVEVLGLLGPEGAMPLHLSRWVLSRLSERWFAGNADTATADTTFLDFCNMLQHRMLALYWRAWGDARPEVQAEHGERGRGQAMQAALGGIGLSGMCTRDAALKLRHATSLGSNVHGPERLTRLVGDLLGMPVGLVEFTGHWMEIPTHLQTRISHSHAVLGKSAVAGRRSFQRQDRAELRIGPLTLADYRRLLDDADLSARLRHAIRFAMGREIDFDLRLVLARSEVPDPKLGACQLGRTTWVAPSRAWDADDLCLHRFTDTAKEAA
jgi:type VI secretion system protein ImpH